MKKVLVLLVLFFAIFANAKDLSSLSPSEIQMIKSSGYGSYLDKLKRDASKKPVSIEKKQVVVNKISHDSVSKYQSNTSANQRLKRFGSSFFNNQNKLNPYSVPTPLDYVLTRGDKLLVDVMGVDGGSNEVVVDRDGTVLIPELGKIKVAGLSFEDAKRKIIEKCKTSFPTNTGVIVSVSEFAPIQVMVTGLVKNPGLYNLTTFSTIKDALLVSGGILDSGSYRNILLKRAGRVIRRFDLYRLLRYGDTSSDIMLRNGDILIVKEVQKSVKLYGAVNIPAIYELKNGEGYRDLMRFSTGLKANGNSNKIILKTFVKNNHVSQQVITLNELYKKRAHDGDEVFVADIDNVFDDKKITITGEVYLPGSYSIKGSYITVGRLIKLAGGLTRKALISRCEITKHIIENDTRRAYVENIDLKDAINSGYKLKYGDEIKIFPISNWSEKKYIVLKGEVKFPGKYAINPGEKLASVIKRAGGFTENSFIEGAVFTRESVKRLQEKQIKESISRLKTKAIALNTSGSSVGEERDAKVRMMASIKELEKKANSLKPIGRISINLYFDLDRFESSPYNITLKDGDSLFVPTMKDTVTVIGQVLNQNTFIYDPSLGASDYLEKAGGLTSTADDDHIYIVKANGEAYRFTNSFFKSNREIFKGDTIVVPMKLDVISNLQFSKDVTDIMYKLAVTTASLKTVGAL